MNKSKTSFAISLSFSIIGIIVSMIFSFVFLIIGAIAGGKTGNLVTIATYMNIVAFGLSFIFSFFCLTKPKFASLMLILSSFINLACMITIFIALKTFSFTIVLFWIPAFIVLMAGILGLTKKTQQ